MTQVALGAAPTPPHVPGKCPFCVDPGLKNYRTKHGALKDESALRNNLAASGMVTDDEGPIYPVPGGDDKTTGWEARAGVFEDFPVQMAAAPHHIIPGKDAMAKSAVEQWTRASKGRIKQDIGYDIDCAANGIFLPHLPEIYFTRTICSVCRQKVCTCAGTRGKMSVVFGQTWAALSDTSKSSIVDTIQAETQLQAHFTSHGTVYNNEARQRCDHVDSQITSWANRCPAQAAGGKLDPPYGAVAWLNGESSALQQSITGHPASWTAFISPYASDFTARVLAGRSSAAQRGSIRRLVSS